MEEVYIQIPRRIYLEMLGEIEDLKEELNKKDALLSGPDSYDKFLIRKNKYINDVAHFATGLIVHKEKLKETKEALNSLKASYNTLSDLYNQKVEETNTLANNVKAVLTTLSSCSNRTNARMRNAKRNLERLYESLLKGAV